MLRALLSHGSAWLAAALCLSGLAAAQGGPESAARDAEFAETKGEIPIGAAAPLSGEAVVRAAPGVAPLRLGTAHTDRVTADDAVVALAELGDLLEAAVGAQVRHTGGIGRAQFLQIRGAGAHQIAVLIDDVPLDGGRGSAFDLSSLPAALVAEAEVLRGAAAAAYGGGAQGGVLRLRTAPPVRRPLTDVRLRLGSTALAQIDATHARGNARRGLRVSLAGSRAEGDFPFRDVNGNDRRRSNQDHRRVGGMINAFNDFRDGGRVTLLLEGVALERGEPGIEQFERPDDESAQHRLQGALTWRRQATSVPVETFALAWARLRGYAFSAPDPLYDGAPYASQDDRSLGGRAEVVASPGPHRLALAADVRHEWAHTRTDHVTGEAPTLRDEQRQTQAVTLSEQLTAHPSLTLLGALRLDDTDRRDAVWLPQLGVAWRPIPGLSLRSNAGRLFRDPGLDELYFEGPGVRGDANLRPEDGLGFDLGAEYVTAHVGLELSGFLQRHDRLIIFAPIDAWRIKARDDFAADIKGLEAAVRLWLGPVSGRVTYTALDAHERGQPGFALPYRPPQRLFAALAAQVGGGAQVYGRLDARAATYTDRFQGKQLPAYALLDLGVRGPLRFVPGLSAGLEVRNLADAQGLDLAQQPRPGRTVLLSLGWTDAGAQ